MNTPLVNLNKLRALKASAKATIAYRPQLVPTPFCTIRTEGVNW